MSIHCRPNMFPCHEIGSFFFKLVRSFFQIECKRSRCWFTPCFPSNSLIHWFIRKHSLIILALVSGTFCHELRLLFRMNKTAKKCYNVSKKYNIEYRHQWMHYMCSGFQKNHCNEWSQGFLSKSWMYSTSLLYFPIENRICLMNHSEIILSQNLIQSSEEIPYFNDEQFHLLKNAPFSKIVLPHFFYFNKSAYLL